MTTPAQPRRRTAVLISGRGSNMRALIDAQNDATYPAEIVLVVSNRPDAAGLDVAKAAGVSTRVVDHRDFSDRDAFNLAIDQSLRDEEIDLVCLAGFMRLLTA
ncbi:MAG: formyltransferase family protein, partial [Pseudomonadota bacterium]